MTLLLVVAGISSCVAVRSRDLPAPDDADLMLDAIDVVPETNGRVLLDALIDKLDVPADNDFEAHLLRVLRENEKPEARVAAVLGANRSVLDAVPAVVAAPSFQYSERTLEEMGSLRYLLLAKLLAVQAYHHACHGRTDASIATGLTAVALGHRVQNAERAALIDMMLGITMSNFAATGLRRSLPLLKISGADARRVAEAMEAYRSDADGWSRVWSFEYRFGKGIILASVQEEFDANAPPFSWHPLSLLPEAYTFQPNRTLDWLAAHYRGYQRDSAVPCARLEPAPPEPSDWQHRRAILDRNGVGSVILQSMPSHRRFQDRRCVGDTELAATVTLLAIRAYQLDHGGLPESLDDLIPAYLSTLPHDGFDDAPLRYSKTARRLHSRGSDRVDRGGESNPSTWLDRDQFAREPTYPIPF